MFAARYPFCLIFCICCGSGAVSGQRNYAAHSVLATGSWHKLAVASEGIYKIDLPMLAAMGIPAGTPSGNIRLYGNGGRMLPEDNARPRQDDLREVVIVADDGGDGVLNGNDCLLFYAEGPVSWRYSGDGYYHERNIYTDSTTYFLTVRPGGLRAATAPAAPMAGPLLSAYDFRVLHEENDFNLLSSGKEWFGEAFALTLPSRTIQVPLPAGAANMTLSLRAVARSTSASRFEAAGRSWSPSPVNGNIFDQYATAVAGRVPYSGNGAIQIRYECDANARGWLDYLVVEGRAPLSMPASGTLLFRDAGASGTVNFELSDAGAQPAVWDVTDPSRPVVLTGGLVQNGAFRFSRNLDTLREFAAFQPATLPRPRWMGAVATQDLHGAQVAGMLIVTVPALKAEAERLAAWHRSKQGLAVAVVGMDEIYNEFGGGMADPTALRDFVKMHCDRSGLANLLLFGRASYKYKDASNMVPTWQSDASMHGINTHMSDDYFAFLGDDDHINGNPLLDIAIGRLPVRNAAEAKAVVDKIIAYHDVAAFGPWRNEMTFAADDEDGNLHLDDAEKVSAIIRDEQPRFNIAKQYLDAWPQVTGSGGPRYPAAREAVDRRFGSGTLVWNYTGHGSFTRLAEETLIDDKSPEAWKNADRLPLIVTATCDFAPFDNPAFHSLGEQLLVRPKGGAIALMTTTRAVFAASNFVMNANYFRLAFAPDGAGLAPTLGHGAMLAKNETYARTGDIVNNRKFQLLGDPAMRLAFPLHRVYTDSLNGLALTGTDSLKALGRYTVAGSVRNNAGTLQDNFSGTVEVAVFDKPAVYHTLGNDAGSRAVDFRQQDRLLFKGSATVRNGRFNISFVVPSDVSGGAGEAKISYYAWDGKEDAAGAHTGFKAEGRADAPADLEGPQIQAWMDNEQFRDGGLTGPDPVLLMRLTDESGINIAGGSGHDLTATLDEGAAVFVLNDAYAASPGTYREGRVRFPLSGLSPGKHTIRLKAWDTHNNSTTINITFTVAPKALLEAGKAYAWPNPFRHQTRFVFDQGDQDIDLDILIRIFTAEGRQVRSIRSTINGQNSRYVGVPWDGRSDSGTKLTPGIYFYQIHVSGTGAKAQTWSGKIILL